MQRLSKWHDPYFDHLGQNTLYLLHVYRSKKKKVFQRHLSCIALLSWIFEHLCTEMSKLNMIPFRNSFYAPYMYKLCWMTNANHASSLASMMQEFEGKRIKTSCWCIYVLEKQMWLECVAFLKEKQI